MSQPPEPSRVYSPTDPIFRDRFAELRDDAPTLLRVRGDLLDLKYAVAIVGTRRAEPEDLEFTRVLARDLARAGCVIVSGGAYGIDAAAHLGALDAGRPTIAVLAGGLDVPYPRGHAALFERIQKCGALVSEYEDATQPRSGYFLRRNRLISAMSICTIVVRAPHKSGAMSTAAATLKLGKPIFAVPGDPRNPLAFGCHELLRRGNRICTSSKDALSLPALSGLSPVALPNENPKNANEIREISADARELLEAFCGKSRSIDELCARLCWNAARIRAVLYDLILRGRIHDFGDGLYGVPLP